MHFYGHNSIISFTTLWIPCSLYVNYSCRSAAQFEPQINYFSDEFNCLFCKTQADFSRMPIRKSPMFIHHPKSPFCLSFVMSWDIFWKKTRTKIQIKFDLISMCNLLCKAVGKYKRKRRNRGKTETWDFVVYVNF